MELSNLYTDYTSHCPRCGANIDHMKYSDKVRLENTYTEFGVEPVFACSNCNQEFYSFQVEYKPCL